MKRNLLSLLFVLLCIPMGIYAQDNLKGDGLKSSIVKYEMTGQGMKVPVTEYRDNYGKLICTQMTIMGGEMGYIINGDKSYILYYTQKQYMELPVPEDEIDYNNLTPEIIEKYKIQATGTSDFLGKKCTVYTAEMESEGVAYQVETWVYKGVALKSVAKTSQGVLDERVAISFEENPNIPASTFEVPEGFTKVTPPSPNQQN